MDTKEIESLMDSMNKEMEKIRSVYQEKMQGVFKDVFKSYFDSCPEVTVFSWRQYTPYFNDGEECTFRCYANHGSATNATDYDNVQWGEYDGEEENVWIDDDYYGNYNEDMIPKHVIENTGHLRKMLGKISDDVFKEMFGDHCIVHATRAGFVVTEYEHD